MNVKGRLDHGAIEGDKMSFQRCEGGRFFEISDDIVPIFCGVREKTIRIPFSSILYFLKNIWKINQDISISRKLFLQARRSFVIDNFVELKNLSKHSTVTKRLPT